MGAAPEKRDLADTPWSPRPQLGPELAAAAGGAAAFANVAASGGAHLGAADEAQRRVRGAPLVRLPQLGRAERLSPGAGRQLRLRKATVRALTGPARAGRVAVTGG